MKRTFTLAEKKEFLANVIQMQETFNAILENDYAEIINNVGLDAYPFNESFDEVHSRVAAWAEVIEAEINKGGK